jgi:hypothetical protein
MAEPLDFGSDAAQSAGNLFNIGATTPDETYESGVLKWVSERVQEGESILRDEPSYDEIDRSISYIMGDQMKHKVGELANCPDNRLKNILNQTVAALTDIHPLFGFKTYNPAFKDQEDILLKLSQAWWVNSFADLRLADIIKFAAGVGTGYAEIAWDPSAQQGAANQACFERIRPRLGRGYPSYSQNPGRTPSTLPRQGPPHQGRWYSNSLCQNMDSRP